MVGTKAAPQQTMTGEPENDAFSGIYSEGNDFGSDVMDLSGVDENGVFTILPSKVYPATLENVEYGMSSKGNQMLTWTFSVIDPETDRKRNLFYHTVIPAASDDSDKKANMLARLKKTILTIAPQYDLRQFRPKELGAEIAGSRCRIRVGTQPYEGKQRNNVKDVLTALEDDSTPYAV